MVSSALTIATTKDLLEEQYLDKHREAESAEEAADGCADEESSQLKPISLDKLKVHVKRHWLMAHTCSPQYVLGHSATYTASGAFCRIGALVPLQALLKEAPLSIEFGGKLLKRAAHDFSGCFMALLMRLQEGVVLASKFVRLLSVVPVHWLQEDRCIMSAPAPRAPAHRPCPDSAPAA